VSNASLSDVPPLADTLSASPRGRKSVNLLALSFFWFPINLFWTVMLQAFLPGRVQELVGDAQKGTYLLYIAAIGAVATTVIQLIVGPISDASAHRWGRRHPFILWGTLGGILAVLGFAVAQNFVLLIVAFFMVQIFLNVANGPYQALMPDNVPVHRHGAASAYMGMALLVGQLVGAILLIFVKPHIGLLGTLIIVMTLLLIGMGITLVFVPDAPAPPDEQMPPLQALETLKGLDIQGNRDYFGLLYYRFYINLSYSTVAFFLLYYLQDTIGPKEAADTNLGYILLTVTVAGLIGTLISGYFADRMSKKRIVYIACTVLALAAGTIAFIHSMTAVLVLAFIFGVGWGAFSAVDWALAVNLLPEGGAARYMAVWHMCMTVPQIIAPGFGPIGDYLNGIYGHGLGWRAAMMSTVLYLVIGTLLLRRVREREVKNPVVVDGVVAAV
jgi:MFS family permease